jgi:mono/diheme cytochrome c family protein
VRSLLSALSCVVLLCWRPAAAQTPDGQAIYREKCRACHGTEGQPTKGAQALYKNIPALDAAFLAKVPADSIMAVLRNGAGRDMKSFKDKLSAAEIAAVAKYVKSAFGAAK